MSMLNDFQVLSSMSTSAGTSASRDSTRSFWENIFCKESLPPLPPPPKPEITAPTGPKDRHATTLRILYHDTQRSFEKFAKQTEKLFKEVGESKNEIKAFKTMFEREHETLIGDIIDLVNRCQTQIQKTVGTPAQASDLSHLQKEVELRLSNFDERLESIKMLNQAHSQALQNQTHVLQTLQEQQNTILTTVLPMLPQIQSLPMHIENAHKAITDVVSKISIPPPASTPPVIACPHSSKSTHSSHSSSRRSVVVTSCSLSGSSTRIRSSKTLKRPFPSDMDEGQLSSPISLTLKKARNTTQYQYTDAPRRSLSHRSSQRNESKATRGQLQENVSQTLASRFPSWDQRSATPNPSVTNVRFPNSTLRSTSSAEKFITPQLRSSHTTFHFQSHRSLSRQNSMHQDVSEPNATPPPTGTPRHQTFQPQYMHPQPAHFKPIQSEPTHPQPIHPQSAPSRPIHSQPIHHQPIHPQSVHPLFTPSRPTHPQNVSYLPPSQQISQSSATPSHRPISQERMPPPPLPNKLRTPQLPLTGPGQPGLGISRSIVQTSTTATQLNIVTPSPAANSNTRTLRSSTRVTSAPPTPIGPRASSRMVPETPARRITRSQTAMRTPSSGMTMGSARKSGVGKFAHVPEGRRFIIFQDSDDDSLTEEDE